MNYKEVIDHCLSHNEQYRYNIIGTNEVFCYNVRKGRDKMIEDFEKENDFCSGNVYDVVEKTGEIYDDELVTKEEEMNIYDYDETVASGEMKDMLNKEGKGQSTNNGGFSDKHYGFEYELTQSDIDNGSVRLDPYFITRQWKLNKKDDTGILFHCLKLIARFGEKNTIEREIRALNAQVKRLADLNGVRF